MANTEFIKIKVEEWFRKKIKDEFPNHSVNKEKVDLIWGGKFEYDAVLKSNDVIHSVYCLSSSEYKTKSGKAGSGKLLKIKADALMLQGAKSPKKVLAFTGKTMYDKLLREKSNGRFPHEIELIYFDLMSEDSELYNSVSIVRENSINELLKK